MPTVEIDIPKLHPGQTRILGESARFNVLECGRRFGKTTFGEGVAAEDAISGKRVGWFAPTSKMMEESWQRMLNTLQPATADVDKVYNRIELHTKGVIDFWSVDHPDSGRGRAYHTAIIDEAGIIRDLKNVWNATIRPTLSDYQGQAWFLGTPKGRRYFHELFDRGQNGTPGWKSWRFGTGDNPYIRKDEIEDMRREMPPEVFNQEVLGIPADDGGNPFGISAIRACIYPHHGGLSPLDPVCFGVDLAKSHDWCVVVGLDADGRVCILDRWQSDWGATRGRILGHVNGWPTLVDATGVGDPIVEDLHAVRMNVEGFKFTSQSKQDLMAGLAAAIQQHQVAFPEGWLTSELESFGYEFHGAGVRYSAPQGLHDDGVCALALAVRAYAKRSRYSLNVRALGEYPDADDDE